MFDPVLCKYNRWIIINLAIKKGKAKWKVKNRFSVALSTENLPQIHWTNVVPIYGIADNKLVITVAPQKDICPQGKTYPIKAVAIIINNKITPIIHVSVYL